MKRLLAILLLFCATLAQAADIYVAQNAIGAGNGTDAADAYGITFLTTVGNWGSGSGQIGPGVTVHLVGTITSYWQVLGSGNAGNPITILFELNAKMGNTVWTGFGSAFCAVYGTGVHDVTIDGGVNGAIYATAEGDGLGNSSGCNGIVFDDPVRVTIKNLAVTNMYVRTAPTNTACWGYGVWFRTSSVPGNSNLVQNCLFHDMAVGVSAGYGPHWTNETVSQCTISNVNWGIQAGDYTSSSTLNGITIFSNNIHGFASWDDPGDNFHHNGVYIWAASGGSVTNEVAYANHLGPGFGAHNTSAYYTSEGPGHIYGGLWHDNLFDCTDGTGPADGLLYILSSSAGAFNVINNDFIGAHNNNVALHWYLPSASSSTMFNQTNNIFQNIGNAVTIQTEPVTAPQSFCFIDYNLYYGVTLTGSSSGFQLQNNGGNANFNYQQFGFDVHSQTGNPLLNPFYVPQTGSAAIATGSTSVYALAPVDYYSVPRLAGTNDIGMVAVSTNSSAGGNTNGLVLAGSVTGLTLQGGGNLIIKGQ